MIPRWLALWLSCVDEMMQWTQRVVYVPTNRIVAVTMNTGPISVVDEVNEDTIRYTNGPHRASSRLGVGLRIPSRNTIYTVLASVLGASLSLFRDIITFRRHW